MSTALKRAQDAIAVTETLEDDEHVLAGLKIAQAYALVSIAESLDIVAASIHSATYVKAAH